jgi:hypothetical protein
MEDWLDKKKGEPVPPAVARGDQPKGGPITVPRPVAPVAAIKVGDRVTGVLVEKSPRGTWKVAVSGFLKSGPIQNSKDMPDSLSVGASVTLVVKISKPIEPGFAWVKD